MTTRPCLVLLGAVFVLPWPAFAQLHPQNHAADNLRETDVQAQVKALEPPPARGTSNTAAARPTYTRHGVIRPEEAAAARPQFGWNFGGVAAQNDCKSPLAQTPPKDGCRRSLWDRFKAKWTDRGQKKDRRPSVIYKDPAFNQH